MGRVRTHTPRLGSVFARPPYAARVLSGAFIAAAALLLLLAAVALAGRYHAYSCRTPSGESAPVDGWGGSTSGSYTYAENTCATGGALVAALSGQVTERLANVNVPTWALTVPAPRHSPEPRYGVLVTQPAVQGSTAHISSGSRARRNSASLTNVSRVSTAPAKETARSHLLPKIAWWCRRRISARTST